MNEQISLNRYNLLPPVVKNLLIINGIFYLAKVALLSRGINLDEIFGLHYFASSKFHIWQILTYMFMHGNFGHLFFNMFSLWMFGTAVENAWGGKRFLVYYFITGIGAAAIHYLILHLQLHQYIGLYPPESFDGINIIGASGSVYGLLLAFGMLFPNSLIYIYFLFPIKAKWFVVIFGALELIYGIVGSSDGVAHFAHLGGMLFGILLILLWRHIDRKSKHNWYDN